MNDATTHLSVASGVDASVASGVDASVASGVDATVASGADAAGSAAQAPRKVARKGLREQAADMRGRFGALPTRQRWLVAGTLAVLGWLVADELVWAPARAWAAESERIEQALDRGARRESTVTTDLRRSVATFGPVALPGPAANGREELARAIDDVLRKHKVGGYSYEARTGQRVKDADAGILGSAIDRLQAEVKFEAKAEDLPKVIADLESNPVIDGITSLRIDKNEQTRKITVQATIEAWVQSAGGRGGR